MIQETPARGQAMWISQSGRSPSSELRFQANLVNSTPAQMNTKAVRSTPMRPNSRPRASQARHLGPHVAIKMRRLAYANHRPDHDGPDEQKTSHLLGPDVGRNQASVAREDLQRDRDQQDEDGKRNQVVGEQLVILARQLAPCAPVAAVF